MSKKRISHCINVGSGTHLMFPFIIEIEEIECSCKAIVKYNELHFEGSGNLIYLKLKNGSIYHFDESANDTLYDSGSNGNHINIGLCTRTTIES